MSSDQDQGMTNQPDAKLPPLMCPKCGLLFPDPYEYQVGTKVAVLGGTVSCPRCGENTPTNLQLGDGTVISLPPVVPSSHCDPLQFLKAREAFPQAFVELPKRVLSPELKEISIFFKTNIYKLYMFWQLPLDLIAEESARSRAQFYSELYVSGCEFDSKNFIDPMTSKFDVSNPNDVERVKNLTTSLFRTWKDCQGGDDQLYARSWEPLIPFHMASGHKRFAFEAILSTMVTGAWTAIETLASDTWEVAVNTQPRLLAKLSKADKNTAVNLMDLRRITKGRFDLQRSMGTLLRERFLFSKLDGIREAYEAAFHDSQSDVIATIRSKSLDALSVARNLIIHRAGQADKEYIKRSPSLKPLPTLEEGKMLPLDGQLVGELIRPALESACTLIEAVDKFLIANPE